MIARHVLLKLSTLLMLIVPTSAGCGVSVPDTTPATTDRAVGGPFENREFIYIGMPDQIPAVDTSPGWTQSGQKMLITGKIYRRDGRTPAPGVVLYYYHTDVRGYYADRQGLDRQVIRHGYIRGWVKSDAEGRYSIYTVRPAPYPNSDLPAHIHPAIKEPGFTEYYIDEFVFDDDKLLTTDKRRRLEDRGGSGVLYPTKIGEMQIVEHDIILGLNIPGYPDEQAVGLRSGREIGEDVVSFMPYHAWGPDRGSRACPICKFGYYHGILYFVGNKPDWPAIEKWLSWFERTSKARQKILKVYFVYGNERGYDADRRRKELEDLGKRLGIESLALTFLPSFTDRPSEVFHNRINGDVGSTMIIYRNRKIIDKYIDLEPTQDNFDRISATLSRTESPYWSR